MYVVLLFVVTLCAVLCCVLQTRDLIPATKALAEERSKWINKGGLGYVTWEWKGQGRGSFCRSSRNNRALKVTCAQPIVALCVAELG